MKHDCNYMLVKILDFGTFTEAIVEGIDRPMQGHRLIKAFAVLRILSLNKDNAFITMLVSIITKCQTQRLQTKLNSKSTEQPMIM